MIISFLLPLAAKFSQVPHPDQWKRTNLSSHISVMLPPDVMELDVPKKTKGFDIWIYAGRGASFAIMSSRRKQEPQKELSEDTALWQFNLGFTRGAISKDFAIKQERDVLKDGWPGLDMLAFGDRFPLKVAVTMRSYIIDGSIYLLAIEYDTNKGTPVGTDRFLDSLILTPKPKLGPHKTAGPTLIPFESKTGGFSILFPNKPKIHDNEMRTASLSGMVHSFESNYGNRIFAVSYIDGPPTGISEELKARVLKESLDDQSAVLQRKEILKRSGYVADRFVFEIGHGMSLEVEAIASRGRFYQLTYAHPTGLVRSDDSKLFFEGFKFLDQAPTSKG